MSESNDQVNNEDRSVMTMCMIWIACVVLYICQTFPITAHLDALAQGITPNLLWTYVGGSIAIIGILLETLADHQKNVAKKTNQNEKSINHIGGRIRLQPDRLLTRKK